MDTPAANRSVTVIPLNLRPAGSSSNTERYTGRIIDFRELYDGGNELGGGIWPRPSSSMPLPKTPLLP